MRRALELDPQLAQAHGAFARSAAVYDWNWSVAEREFKRSIELNPNVASTHYMYGLACLAPLRRFDEATAEIKRALELEPLSVPIMHNLALMYVYARKNDLAVEDTPLKTQGEPLFRLLREPKRLVLYDGGHIPPFEFFVPTMNAWLDETLGTGQA